MKKVICAFLCALMFATCAQPFGAAAKPQQQTKLESGWKAQTYVSGYKSSYNVKQSDKLAFNIQVTPANPLRYVFLQQYSSKQKQYITRASYPAYGKKAANVRIVIPKEYRKKTYGRWRIVIDENDHAKGYCSPDIKVYSENVKKLDLSSTAACIYCLNTNKVLYDKRMNKRLKPASCTKIMTLITAIQYDKLNKTTPSTYSARMAPQAKLHSRSGDRFKNRDLAYAMILGSANDAAIMIANGSAGSNEKFVKKMNKNVKKLKLKNTHFTNTYGLPNKKHYTTAYDLSRITAYGYSFKDFRKITGREGYSFTSAKYHKKCSFYTADHMVRDDVKGHIGGKTGYLEQYGASYSGLYKYKGNVYAVTIINAESKAVRWKDVRKLYKYIRKNANNAY